MKKIRCAIYTRKSAEEGLDQEFNSLDAQREACAAYVASQKAEGWVLLVWSKYSNAQRVSSLHLSKGCLNPPSRSDTYSSSAEGVAMDWKVLALFTVGDVYASLCKKGAYAPFSAQRRLRALFWLQLNAQ